MNDYVEENLSALLALGIALLVIVMARLAQHRRGGGQEIPPPRGWVPWNGLMIIAILTAAVSIAHLLRIGAH